MGHFLNFWVSDCIFQCILDTILSATLLNSTGQSDFWRLGGMAPLPSKSDYDGQYSRV